MATKILSMKSIQNCAYRFFSNSSTSAKVKGQQQMVARVPVTEGDPVVTTTILGANRILYKHDPELEKTDPYYGVLADPDYFKTANLFKMRDLVNARVHLGHKLGTVNPLVKKYLFGERLDICIFDLDQTAAHLRLALNYLAHVAYRAGIILFVTANRWHVHMVEKAAKNCGEYSHCHKFRTNTLTNAEHMFGATIRFPDVVLFLSTMGSQLEEHRLVTEAAMLNITTVGIVDTNCNPNLITYPIPGNDDSLASCQFYLKMFTEAIRLGKEKRREHFGVISRSGEKLVETGY